MPSEMRFNSPVDIEAAADANTPVLVRVDAYSGGLMTVAGFGPVVLNVDGIQSPERVPLLAEHENRIDAVLGSGTGGSGAERRDEKKGARVRELSAGKNTAAGGAAAPARGGREARTAVAALRKELAAETARITAVRKICAGRHAAIEATAIGD